MMQEVMGSAMAGSKQPRWTGRRWIFNDIFWADIGAMVGSPWSRRGSQLSLAGSQLNRGAKLYKSFLSGNYLIIPGQGEFG